MWKPVARSSPTPPGVTDDVQALGCDPQATSAVPEKEAPLVRIGVLRNDREVMLR